MITNEQSGTRIDEIADRIFRINTPVETPAGAFSFNQYLIDDEMPLLFHTGPRRMFPLVHEAVKAVLDPSRIAYFGFSHFEADECGALNEWLAASPNGQPLCSQIAALVSVDDVADRAARPLADNETLAIGARRVRWIDTPHLPHGWETGYLFEETTGTLLCGDLFTQPGRGDDAVTESDILAPSEAFRGAMDYFSATKNVLPLIEKLALTNPKTLACMHGSAWRGDGASLLRELGRQLDQA